jgi:protein-L-isoaspartate O-methyltransferase
MKAIEIFTAFKARPGSEFIASPFAIDELSKLVIGKRPKRVLEVGAGIGTLTYVLCRLKEQCPFELVSVEWNDFCLGELAKNVDGEFTLVNSMDDASGEFDLIVIDGGSQDPRFVSALATRGVIFIEGFMDKKHALIRDVYRNKRKYASSNWRSKDRRSGIWLFQFEPTASESMWYSVNSFWNRVRSAIKRLGLVSN